MVLVKTFTTPGTPADAATKFAGTPTLDVAKSAQIVYPLNNVVMPQNVYPADIQWTNDESRREGCRKFPCGE